MLSFDIGGFRKPSKKLNKVPLHVCLKKEFYFHNKRKYSFNIEFFKHFFFNSNGNEKSAGKCRHRNNVVGLDQFNLFDHQFLAVRNMLMPRECSL